MNKEKLAESAKKHTRAMDEKFKIEEVNSINTQMIFEDTYTFESMAEYRTLPVESLVCKDVESAIRDELKILKHGARLAVLNFASFKNPGGGFIRGSMAQEEALCHCTNLYNILEKNQEYYEYNRQRLHRGMYENRALYHRGVIFTGTGSEEKKGLIDVITCAAPNLAPAIRYHNGVTKEENSEVLKSRIGFLRDIAEEMGVNVIILGAYGCGVFKQDAREVAQLFKRYFGNTTVKRVVYAIPDERSLNYRAFKEIFNSKEV